APVVRRGAAAHAARALEHREVAAGRREVDAEPPGERRRGEPAPLLQRVQRRELMARDRAAADLLALETHQRPPHAAHERDGVGSRSGPRPRGPAAAVHGYLYTTSIGPRQGAGVAGTTGVARPAQGARYSRTSACASGRAGTAT